MNPITSRQCATSATGLPGIYDPTDPVIHIPLSLGFALAGMTAGEDSSAAEFTLSAVHVTLAMMVDYFHLRYYKSSFTFILP